MRKYLTGIGAAAIVALAGCGGNDMPGTDHGQTETSVPGDSAEQAEHNDQDIAFAQAMIPHHQQAVDMAGMAAAQATDPAVKDLATRIEAAQDPEIQQLTDLLDQWGAEPAPGMDHSGHGGTPGEGMMTDEQMQQLEQASGAEFDRLWIQLMLQHHEGAVAMAETELEQGGNAEAKALAQQIIETQEAEIRELQAMLPQ
jgi:uncharacterized protein (DUF305 family)